MSKRALQLILKFEELEWYDSEVRIQQRDEVST